ncbi:MAG: hypothetical protein U9N45_03535, partial [Gemmatimonadota bacterium]|nr:hypothetical protein [Gemmatimonadota bacterium]
LEQRPVSELPNEFLARCLSTEKVNAKLAGTYFQRFEMIFFVDSERMLNITPLTPGKLKTLTGASFLLQDNILQLPLCSGSEGNLNWINRNLPEGEIERSRQEIENLEHSKTEIQMKKNMEAFSLKQIPEDIYDRSADSGTLDSENIGRLGIYRGVLAFINPDKRVFVSWYTPDKQETLEECGYNTDGRLPIKVPYAMPETVQREWLMKNLPEPDEEELISVDENAE